jgi:hypothetical protein
VDYIALGLAWSILNQNRDRHTPTWVLRIEGRLSIGNPLYACKSQMGVRTCGHQGADADGSAPDWEESQGIPTQSGMSRGFNTLHVETAGSWRYRHIEPYAGLWADISWPGYSNPDFLPVGELDGYINTLPPIIGELTGGVAIIPYEDREHFQRFTVDLRVMGRYISEGHGYSPLYDALGTSPNLYLSTENLEGSPNPTANGLGRVPFYGLTDMQSHMRFGGMLRLEMRAARYVRFELGGAFYYTSPYIITFADACNPNVSGVPDDDRRRGSCRSGIINPHHRAAIDLPGQRFRVGDSYTFDLFVSATGQF